YALPFRRFEAVRFLPRPSSSERCVGVRRHDPPEVFAALPVAYQGGSAVCSNSVRAVPCAHSVGQGLLAVAAFAHLLCPVRGGGAARFRSIHPRCAWRFLRLRAGVLEPAARLSIGLLLLLLLRVPVDFSPSTSEEDRIPLPLKQCPL